MRATAPLLLFLVLASSAAAQHAADLQSEVDRRYALGAVAEPAPIAVPASVPPAGASGAQEDVWLPSPRGALFRSLAVPGWGQIYNRQPLKAPVIWAGLGTLIGVTVHSNNRVILFRRAAIFDDCSERPQSVPADVCANFERFADEFARADELTAGPINAPAARSLRDQFRRQRDLFALFSVMAYGLQALDAFVAAELADFDIGEDLTVGVGASTGMPAVALQWRF